MKSAVKGGVIGDFYVGFILIRLGIVALVGMGELACHKRFLT